MGEIQAGDEIRPRLTRTSSTRKIVFISDHWVVYSVTAPSGEFIHERVMAREDFDAKMEKVKVENPLLVSQRYMNTTGRVLEIVGRDTVYSQVGQVDVIAYRFAGGTGTVYLRAADEEQVKYGWTLQTP